MRIYRAKEKFKSERNKKIMRRTTGVQGYKFELSKRSF